MNIDPSEHHRKFLRLKGYDYSQAGGYFVTIVTEMRRPHFSEVREEEMIVNNAGRMVKSTWETLTTRFPNIELDIFQIMPNHFHGIIFIHPVGAGLVPAQGLGQSSPTRTTTRVAPTLGDIVGAFKSITTHEYIRGVRQFEWPPFPGRLWQRNYYEHVIRDEQDYQRIFNYISNNPSNWAEDEENK